MTFFLLQYLFLISGLNLTEKEGNVVIEPTQYHEYHDGSTSNNDGDADAEAERRFEEELRLKHENQRLNDVFQDFLTLFETSFSRFLDSVVKPQL